MAPFCVVFVPPSFWTCLGVWESEWHRKGSRTSKNYSLNNYDLCLGRWWWRSRGIGDPLLSTGPPKLCKKACSILWFNKGIFDGNKKYRNKMCVQCISLSLSPASSIHDNVSINVYIWKQNRIILHLETGSIGTLFGQNQLEKSDLMGAPLPNGKHLEGRVMPRPSDTITYPNYRKGWIWKWVETSTILQINLIAETLSSYDVTLGEN